MQNEKSTQEVSGPIYVHLLIVLCCPLIFSFSEVSSDVIFTLGWNYKAVPMVFIRDVSVVNMSIKNA